MLRQHFTSIRICGQAGLKKHLIRSETMRRVTVLVGDEVSPVEIPVALRAPSISTGPQLTLAERRTVFPIIEN